jgi:YD repeat-containing protein
LVDDTTHKYFVNGTKILIEELNTNSVKKYLKYKCFGDKLYGFNYNEVDYYYLRNTQGDITSIIDRNGIEVARYTYDAWGNHVVNNLTEDNIDDISPFRIAELLKKEKILTPRAEQYKTTGKPLSKIIDKYSYD